MKPCLKPQGRCSHLLIPSAWKFDCFFLPNTFTISNRPLLYKDECGPNEAVIEDAEKAKALAENSFGGDLFKPRHVPSCLIPPLPKE
jgi:hypothetical protein